MIWVFDQGTVSNELNITYKYKKMKYFWNMWRYQGQCFKNRMMNVFHMTNFPEIKGPLFSYAHVIYYLVHKKLKEGWNIICYDTDKAIVTKGTILFQEVQGFKTLEELYQYLYRFEFDEEKEFQLIMNKDKPLDNIGQVLDDPQFIKRFNLNKKFPFWDLLVGVGLLLLLTQTSEIIKSHYPKDDFFKMIYNLETKIGGQGMVRKIESKNGILKIVFHKNTSDDLVERIKKELRYDVIVSKN